jgi:NhaP-type Na+/H+ or K+/H+ antiporter
MNDEQVKKIIDSPQEYDDSKEESYISFVHFFFFLALAILSGILFLISETTKYQIMYAAFFICLLLIAYLIKIFAWVWGSRNIISREIKRLELRIAELSETVKKNN